MSEADIDIGPIISGTLHADKVIQALVEEMERLGGNPELIKLAKNALVIGFKTDEEVAWGQAVIDSLQESIHNQFSPPFAYFGVNPKNPTEIGFWPDWAEIEKLPHVTDYRATFDHEYSAIEYSNWVNIYQNGKVIAEYDITPEG